MFSLTFLQLDELIISLLQTVVKGLKPLTPGEMSYRYPRVNAHAHKTYTDCHFVGDGSL